MSKFGEMIRARRQELGIPQARVAQLIGRAATTVRTWEQGRSSPTDAHVVETLAAVLQLDAVSLLEAADLQVPAPSTDEEHPTVEQIYRSLTESTVREPDERVAVESDEWPPRAKRDAEPAVPTAVEPIGEATTEETLIPSPIIIGTIRPTRAVDDPIPARVTVADPYPVPHSDRSPSYLESAYERNVYRVRAALTVAILIVLVAGLAWAANSLWDTVAGLWNDFTRGFR